MCSFQSHRWFFDKVLTHNVGNLTVSKGFHRLQALCQPQNRPPDRKYVTVYQQEISLYMVKFTLTACAQIKCNGNTFFFFLQNKFTDKRISVVGNKFSAKFGIFVLSGRLKNVNNFRIVVLGPRPMTPVNLHFGRLKVGTQPVPATSPYNKSKVPSPLV